jgi:hypothetical protein
VIGTELEGRVGFIDDLRHVTVNAVENSEGLILFFCVDKWDIELFHITFSHLTASSRYHLEGLSMNNNKLKINKLVLDLPANFALDLSQEQQPLKVTKVSIDSLECSQLNEEILSQIKEKNIKLHRHSYIKQAATVVTQRILDQDKTVQLPDYFLEQHTIGDLVEYVLHPKNEPETSNLTTLSST